MWDFFDRKVCLTADPGEWAKAEAEFKRIGLDDVQRFSAMPHIGPHQSFNVSTRQILIEFFESSNERLLFLEDDCVFKGHDHVEQALNELPDDWDIVYFGCNIKDEKPVKWSEHLHKIQGAFTTHCIGYNKKCIPFILENQPGFSECMFDNWLSANLSRLNAYVINPMVAWQRPRHSKIWDRQVNYDEHFIESQNKLTPISSFIEGGIVKDNPIGVI
jgi:hypothetical protein